MVSFSKFEEIIAWQKARELFKQKGLYAVLE
jgi:hypothetical protein